jgi:hypothetical protein
MVPVAISVSATDNCDPIPTCEIITISSNEPANGLGDGNTDPDWEVTGSLAANLRAERSGRGGDRVYTLAVSCIDACGNRSTEEEIQVVVPHNQRRRP